MLPGRFLCAAIQPVRSIAIHDHLCYHGTVSWQDNLLCWQWDEDAPRLCTLLTHITHYQRATTKNTHHTQAEAGTVPAPVSCLLCLPWLILLCVTCGTDTSLALRPPRILCNDICPSIKTMNHQFAVFNWRPLRILRRLLPPITVTVVVALLLILSPWSRTLPAAAQSPCGPTAPIIAGDTLAIIAARCNVSVAAIIEANPWLINLALVPEGQVINSPTSPPQSPVTQSPVAKAPVISVGVTPAPALLDTRGYQVYTVQRGDWLSKIAYSYNTTLAAILAANPTLVNPNRIEVGQQILLPPAGAVCNDSKGVNTGIDTGATLGADLGANSGAIVLDSRNEIAQAQPTLPIPAANISLFPPSGPAGTAVTVTATSLAPNSSFNVSIAPGRAQNEVLQQAATSDASGILRTVVTIPTYALGGEQWVITLTPVALNNQSIAALFSVTGGAPVASQVTDASVINTSVVTTVVSTVTTTVVLADGTVVDGITGNPVIIDPTTGIATPIDPATGLPLTSTPLPAPADATVNAGVTLSAGAVPNQPPLVGISPASGPPGTTVQLTGRNFDPNATLDIRIGREVPNAVTQYSSVGSAFTDAGGNLTQAITLPATATPGARWVIAVVDHNSGFTALTNTFAVTDAALSAQAPSPGS